VEGKQGREKWEFEGRWKGGNGEKEKTKREREGRTKVQQYRLEISRNDKESF